MIMSLNFIKYTIIQIILVFSNNGFKMRNGTDGYKRSEQHCVPLNGTLHSEQLHANFNALKKNAIMMETFFNFVLGLYFSYKYTCVGRLC